MKLYQHVIIPVMLMLMVLTSGCRKYLEVDLPKDLTLTDKVFGNDETATGAALNMYSSMFNSNANPYAISLSTAISSDEIKTYNFSFQSMYLNNCRADDPFVENIWNDGYNIIYQANAVYEGCKRSQTLSQELVKQLTGEALFIRAYWHFYLYNLYGDIPIITTTDYRTNAVISRSQQADVYAQIKADLTNASELLKNEYVGKNSISESSERIRPNSGAALALLARVYLYENNFEKAEQTSSLVIADAKYELAEIKDVFHANNSEAIWQLRFTDGSFFNTPEALQYILSGPPATLSTHEISILLKDAFSEKDKRLSEWIGVYTEDNSPEIKYYFPYKYKVRFGADASEYSTILRLAEQFLIRAECRAETDNIMEAVKDLDKIRARAGLPLLSEINPGISKSALIDSIMIERQRELFSEQGHRWFDLKRRHAIDKVMNVVTPAKGGPVWEAFRQLWPIPRTEILANPNLKQNQGYN